MPPVLKVAMASGWYMPLTMGQSARLIMSSLSEASNIIPFPHSCEFDSSSKQVAHRISSLRIVHHLIQCAGSLPPDLTNDQTSFLPLHRRWLVHVPLATEWKIATVFPRRFLRSCTGYPAACSYAAPSKDEARPGTRTRPIL